MENISEIKASEHQEIEEMPSLEVKAETQDITLFVKAVNNNRHKEVICPVCSKQMKSDKLKRHRKTHADIIALDYEARTVELSKLQEAYEFREQQNNKLER